MAASRSGETLADDPKISVSRTAPSATLCSSFASCPTAVATSVEPPPMSITSERAPRGWPFSTPRQMSRASSRPDTTSSSSAASRRTRRTTSSRLRASRTALVATARTVAW